MKQPGHCRHGREVAAIKGDKNRCLGCFMDTRAGCKALANEELTGHVLTSNGEVPATKPAAIIR